MAAPASPEQGKLATRLRAQLEVHKEALQAAREETTALASSLEKANSLIEVCALQPRLAPVSRHANTQTTFELLLGRTILKTCWVELWRKRHSRQMCNVTAGM